jgi:CheY-like chemotaxis protein
MNPKRAQILMLEDNAADVYLFRKALEDANVNFELTVFKDGRQALEFFRGEGSAGEQSPDLAVLDVNVPKNDGLEVLQALRKNRRFDRVPVVITSSSPSLPPHSAIGPLENVRYIRKPADLEEFLQIGVILRDILRDSGAQEAK